MELDKEIVDVTLKSEVDYDYPVNDDLGFFDCEAKSDLAINHWRRGGNVRDDFEWFNSTCASTKADAERDYLLMLDICNNRKFFIRIQMIAKIRVKVGDLWLSSTVKSDLYDGILDENREGIEDAKRSATADITDLLLEAGFSKKQVKEAIKNMREEGDA